MADETSLPLESLLAEAIEHLDDGDDRAVDALLTAHPELSDALAALRGAGLVQGDLGAPPLDGSVGGHRLVRRLGEGAMGVVWLAVQESVQRPVALKLMRPELAASATAVERFRREARAVARLSHPHVVTLLDAGEDRGVLWTALELVPGEGLDERLADPHRRPPLPLLLGWCRDLARGLAAAHAEGIVHRDVKPANVRITPDERALLLDFGLARDATEASLSATGSFQGSPAYAAPEQVEGRRESIGPATDTYALGVLLYEAISGRVPFPGRTTEQVFHRVLTGDAVPLRRLVPDVSRDLATVVGKALERDATRRYQDAGLLADDLDALIGYRPVSARPPGPARCVRRWLGRHRVAGLAALVALVVAVGLGLSEELRRREQASAELRRAEGLLEQLAASREETLGLAAAAAGVAADLESHVEPALWQAVDQQARRLAELRAERRRLGDELGAVLEQVQLLDVGRAEAAEALGLAWLVERWHVARGSGQDGLADELAAEVRRRDAGGRFTAELSRTGRLSLRVDPPTAELRLFAARRRDRLVSGAEPRRVWQPLRSDGDTVVPARSVVSPGTWALRPSAARAPLRPDDRVVAVAGHPVEGSVLVASGELRGARLLSVGDITVREPYDADQRLAARGHEEPLTWVLELAGKRHERRGPDAAAAGLELAAPADLVAAGGVAVDVVREGAHVTLELTTGQRCVASASPLFLDAAEAVDAERLSAWELPAGEYLVAVRAPGRLDARLPLTVEAGEVTDRRLVLIEERGAPGGFVPLAGPLPGVDTPFWIQEREVTIAEYLAFLNRPETAAVLNAATEPMLYPRATEADMWVSYLPRDASGWYVVAEPLRPACPVIGVSRDDALAFAAWMSELTGGSWSFDLPSVAEVDALRAALPGRRYPWGDVFRPAWTNGWAARPTGLLMPVHSQPVDETPHGVFNLAGGVSEWTRTEGQHGMVPVLGGAYTYRKPGLFANDSAFYHLPGESTSTRGFRLVARPTDG